MVVGEMSDSLSACKEFHLVLMFLIDKPKAYYFYLRLNDLNNNSIEKHKTLTNFHGLYLYKEVFVSNSLQIYHRFLKNIFQCVTMIGSKKWTYRSYLFIRKFLKKKAF